MDKVLDNCLLISSLYYKDISPTCIRFNISYSALIFYFTASGISFRLGITVPVRVVPNFVSSFARMRLV